MTTAVNAEIVRLPKSLKLQKLLNPQKLLKQLKQLKTLQPNDYIPGFTELKLSTGGL